MATENGTLADRSFDNAVFTSGCESRAAPPRTRWGMPARPRASAMSAACAFVRTSTA